jgi:hypothetical protein
VDEAGRRDRHFRRPARDQLEKGELVGRDAAHALELAFGIGGLELGVSAAVKIERRVLRGEPFHRLDEAEEPRAAPKLAVGDRLQADLLLHCDGFADGAILEVAEFLGVDPSAVVVAGRVLEHLRAQQASHVVGAERRLGAGHAHSAAARAAAAFCSTKSYRIS